MEKDKNDLCCSCAHSDVVEKAQKNALSDEIIYDVADFFKVFGDSTRIKILYALLNQDMCVGDLVESLNMTQSAVSHQLRVLRQNDLVKYKKQGKAVVYSLDDEHIAGLLQQGLCHILHKKNYERDLFL